MSIAIVFNQKQTEEWENQLKELLPNEKIEVYPYISNFDEVEFVATWKPESDVFLKFPNLKCIQSVGAGVDQLLNVNLPGDVIVTRIVDQNLAQDMFEHVLTCIMNSMKNFNFYLINQIENKWSPQNYLSIDNTTVTILGLGQIGKLVATKLAQLGFNVRGWSNSPKSIDGVHSYFGSEQLKNALSHTNFIVNILPLTSSTVEILNQDLFSQLHEAVLINVGRGKHLNEKNLIDALEKNQIKEAYLDVFETEPLPKNHPFWNHKKIFITPHIASITNPSTAINQVVENYKRLKKSQELLHVVDLTKEY